MKDPSIGTSFIPSSNNTPSSPPSCLGCKIKSLAKETYDDELPAGIGDGSYFSSLVIDYVLKMGNPSGGNCFI